jgi:exosortase
VLRWDGRLSDNGVKRFSEDLVRATTHRESTSRLSPILLFSILGAISLAIWWRPLTSSFALALHDEQYTHILLILPMSAALIFVNWRPLDWNSPAPPVGVNRKYGSVLLVAAVLAMVTVRWRAAALPSDVQLSISMLALVVWWIAAFILCFGTRAFRRAMFPLGFLLWMVPFPDFLLNPIIGMLQRGSAASAHLLFLLAGIPVEQRGMLVHIPGLTMEVAPECSSIRSSLLLLVTTMVLAQLVLRSFWRKALVVAVTIPLSVAKNGLRIFALGVLATRVNPSFLDGNFHRHGGIIFFLIGLAVIFLLLWILRRGEDKKPGIR